MARVHNFGAGPAALPLPVLEQAQNELLDFQGNGMSIMEMSHRSAAFQEVIDAAEANLRSLLGISDDYAVLFLQGGASQQFALIPMNLRPGGASADYIHTGSWAGKAYKEAALTGEARLAWDGKSESYLRIPKASELDLDDSAAYAHITSNETIGGIQWQDFPATKAPLIADMSSDFLSRPLDVNRFGMIYGGAQKNIGPSGMAVVILRKDLAERCAETVPYFFRYNTHIDAGSLYNTPNTWAIYIVKLVTEWVASIGGLDAMKKRNEDKAKILYDALDASSFYNACADAESRSLMNVTWRLPSEDLEKTFIKEATAAGFIGLKGHRSVGGIRASIYNACEPDSIRALTAFMSDFEANNG